MSFIDQSDSLTVPISGTTLMLLRMCVEHEAKRPDTPDPDQGNAMFELQARRMAEWERTRDATRLLAAVNLLAVFERAVSDV